MSDPQTNLSNQIGKSEAAATSSDAAAGNSPQTKPSTAVSIGEGTANLNSTITSTTSGGVSVSGSTVQGNVTSTDNRGAIIHNHVYQAQPSVTKPAFSSDRAVEAITNSRPNQDALVSRFMEELAKQLRKLITTYSKAKFPGKEISELMVLALEETTELVEEFSKLGQSIAEMKSEDAAQALHEGFVKILEMYQPKVNPHTNAAENMPEFPQFIAHELFVSFVALFIKNKRWGLLNTFLLEPFSIPNKSVGLNYTQTRGFTYIPKTCTLLEHYKVLVKSEWASYHAYLLKERHNQSPLDEVVSFEQFIEAENFLCIWSYIKGPQEFATYFDTPSFWEGWSLNYLYDYQSLQYSLEVFGSSTKPQALREAFGFDGDIDELKRLIAEAQRSVYRKYYRNRGNRV